jgi:6-pyruvoyltetrahydropterin/6-carboxytetrahydropterin synthase
MAYTISKRHHFSASHILAGLPEGHPCGRLHGHNYEIDVRLSSASVDPVTGFVLDYGELKPFLAWVDSTLDHRHLNDLLTDTNPTAENLSRILARTAQHILGLPEHVTVEVAVSETPKTWATWRP